jgi:hypothetical protein
MKLSVPNYEASYQADARSSCAATPHPKKEKVIAQGARAEGNAVDERNLLFWLAYAVFNDKKEKKHQQVGENDNRRKEGRKRQAHQEQTGKRGEGRERERER